MGEYKKSFTDQAVDNAWYLAACYAGYWAFVYLCAFYPAFVMSLQITRWFYGIPSEHDKDVYFSYHLTSILLFILFAITIYLLLKAKQWFFILMSYGITFLPFIYMWYHYYISFDNYRIDIFPLPIRWLFFC